MNKTNEKPEMIKTWKVQTTVEGVIITINGKEYRTHAGESLAWDIDHAARGWNK